MRCDRMTTVYSSLLSVRISGGRVPPGSGRCNSAPHAPFFPRLSPRLAKQPRISALRCGGASVGPISASACQASATLLQPAAVDQRPRLQVYPCISDILAGKRLDPNVSAKLRCYCYVRTEPRPQIAKPGPVLSTVFLTAADGMNCVSGCPTSTAPTSTRMSSSMRLAAGARRRRHGQHGDPSGGRRG